MGSYTCIANNGIPPQANATFNLEVHCEYKSIYSFPLYGTVNIVVPPLIRIRNQMVGVSNGSVARLECDVEAFPEAVM